MNAQEARQLTRRYFEQELISFDDINSRIEAAAKQGLESIQIEIIGLDWNLRDRAFEAIESRFGDKELAHPFKVTRNQWSDQRDSAEGDTVTISWR